MNEPEPSAVANGSPPQASPFPFGRAAVSTPTDDAGNPLRRMRRDTLFCRSSYDSCRRQATGHSPKRELHASTPVQPVRPNAKRRKSPPKRGFTMEMRGSFCCPTRFALARQPRKTQESDTSRLQKASNFIRRASRRQVRPPERPPSRRDSAAPQPPDSLRADRPPSASRASERLWGTSRAHVRAA